MRFVSLLLRVALGFVLGVVATLAFVAYSATRLGTPPPEHQSFDLPAGVMDVELVGGTGFASLADGRVIAFDVPARGSTSLEWREIITGLTGARGIAVADGAIYIAAFGPEACPGGDCQKTNADDELATISRSNGRIHAFSLEGGDGHVILDGIPVVGRDHGLNDVEVGPDGMLYLSVGHVDLAWNRAGEIPAQVRLDWLGSVLRITPQGQAEVFASGLRNVYGLTFTAAGQLLGVDNDGVTVSGWRDETLIEIAEGTDYGYPAGPNREPSIVRLAEPASAGISATDGGVLIGNCTQVIRVPLRDHDGSLILNRQRFDVRTVIRGPGGCITSIAVDGDLTVAGVYGSEGRLIFLRDAAE